MHIISQSIKKAAQIEQLFLYFKYENLIIYIIIYQTLYLLLEIIFDHLTS